MIPDRVLYLAGFDMPDELWDSLLIPVNMAFFFRSTAEGRVVPLYPGPAGATESLLELESWKDYTRLFELAHLAIVNRPGFSFREDLAPFQILKKGQTVSLPAKPAVFYLPFVEQPISSTEIRDDRRRGVQVSQWLPPMVWNYIEKHKLYS